MRQRDPKIDLLTGISLFASCDDRQLKEIARLVDEVAVTEGSVLIEEGSTNCREAFIVLEGTATVSVRGVQVAVVGPGGITGEMGVIDHEQRSATVRALTDMRLLVVDARGLHALLEKHGVGWRLLRETGQRVRALESGAVPL
jgi:CRP/FNR family cyclic AMP-dependent transcriptional regulator